MTLFEILGYAALILLIASFFMQTIIWLRLLAIASNAAVVIAGIVRPDAAAPRPRSRHAGRQRLAPHGDAPAGRGGERRDGGQGARSASTGFCPICGRSPSRRDTSFSARARSPTRCTSSRPARCASTSSMSRSARAPCSARSASSRSIACAPRRRPASSRARSCSSPPKGPANSIIRTRSSASSSIGVITRRLTEDLEKAARK